MRFAFIAAEKASYPIRLMCRVLMVSRSGYYAWLGRDVSARAQSNALLRVQIRSSHAASRESYGSPRVHRDLRDRGISCSLNRVARQMRIAGLRAKKAVFWKLTTKADTSRIAAPNRLAQTFDAKRPNEKWVADITYVHTDEGWLYLAVVLDLFSRKIVGHAIESRVQQATRYATGQAYRILTDEATRPEETA